MTCALALACANPAEPTRDGGPQEIDGNVVRDAGEVDADAGVRDAATDRDGGPVVDGGFQDAGARDAGDTNDIPRCTTGAPLTFAATFRSDELILAPEGAAPVPIRNSSAEFYAAIGLIDETGAVTWTAETRTPRAVLSYDAVRDPADGSVFAVFGAAVAGVPSIVFENADGSDGATFTAGGAAPRGYPVETHASPDPTQCFVVRYDPAGAVTWASRFGQDTPGPAFRTCAVTALSVEPDRVRVDVLFFEHSSVPVVFGPGESGERRLTFPNTQLSVVADFDKATGALLALANVLVQSAGGVPGGFGAFTNVRGGRADDGSSFAVASLNAQGTSNNAYVLDPGETDARPFSEALDAYGFIAGYAPDDTRRFVRLLRGNRLEVNRAAIVPSGGVVLGGFDLSTNGSRPITFEATGAPATLTGGDVVWFARYDATGDPMWLRGFDAYAGIQESAAVNLVAGFAVDEAAGLLLAVTIASERALSTTLPGGLELDLGLGERALVGYDLDTGDAAWVLARDRAGRFEPIAAAQPIVNMSIDGDTTLRYEGDSSRTLRGSSSHVDVVELRIDPSNGAPVCQRRHARGPGFAGRVLLRP